MPEVSWHFSPPWSLGEYPNIESLTRPHPFACTLWISLLPLNKDSSFSGKLRLLLIKGHDVEEWEWGERGFENLAKPMSSDTGDLKLGWRCAAACGSRRDWMDRSGKSKFTWNQAICGDRVELMHIKPFLCFDYFYPFVFLCSYLCLLLKLFTVTTNNVYLNHDQIRFLFESESEISFRHYHSLFIKNRFNQGKFTRFQPDSTKTIKTNQHEQWAKLRPSKKPILEKRRGLKWDDALEDRLGQEPGYRRRLRTAPSLLK